MAGPFANAVDRIFAGALAEDATYYSCLGEDPKRTVRIITRRPDDLAGIEGLTITSNSTLVDVRVSEVAAPVANDEIAIGGERFVVQGVPRRDRLRLVWSLDLRPKGDGK